MSSYFKKLLDPRWQKKRLETLEAAEWRCECCMGGDETLHVHHKQYFKGKEPWEYEKEQLAVLCAECHENYHADIDRLQWVASFAPINGPLDRSDAAWMLAGAIGMPKPDDYLYAEALHALGGAAVCAATAYYDRVGMKNIAAQDRSEIARVAMEAVFKHFGQSLDRKNNFGDECGVQ